MNKINKKGQVGITINWVPATIIVFFIMLVFVLMATSAAGKRQLNQNDISLIKGGFIELENQNILFVFLKDRVLVDGGYVNVLEQILNLTEPYFDSELREFIKLEDINEINVYNFNALSRETKLKLGIDFEKEQKIIKILQENFDDTCYDYVLKFPFGYFYRFGDEKKFVRDLDASGISKEVGIALGEYSVVSIPYNGENVEIKLKSRYTC